MQFFLREPTHRFARNIDGVLVALAEDVAWANGMDGGHVYGHKGLRDYWTRQWSMVSPHVEPVEFQQTADGSITVEVIQSVFDLNGIVHQIEATEQGFG